MTAVAGLFERSKPPADVMNALSHLSHISFESMRRNNWRDHKNYSVSICFPWGSPTARRSLDRWSRDDVLTHEDVKLNESFALTMRRLQDAMVK